MAAARQAVLDRGVLDLRLRDVAEQADMSTGSVLYYFPTLAELLREVQREAVERFAPTARPRPRANPTRAAGSPA
ncbi:hypothetical protein GCM10029964_051410 [Kibdelosporangium lantanae]